MAELPAAVVMDKLEVPPARLWATACLLVLLLLVLLVSPVVATSATR